jgi:hypothetical protein
MSLPMPSFSDARFAQEYDAWLLGQLRERYAIVPKKTPTEWFVGRSHEKAAIVKKHRSVPRHPVPGPRITLFYHKMADRARFELAVGLTPHPLSRRAH